MKKRGFQFTSICQIKVWISIYLVRDIHESSKFCVLFKEKIVFIIMYQLELEQIYRETFSFLSYSFSVMVEDTQKSQ